MTGDRAHYHGDGCAPPHPAATLEGALWEARRTRRWDPSWSSTVRHVEFDAAEVLRLLASGECDELNAAVADAVAANPGWYGLEPTTFHLYGDSLFEGYRLAPRVKAVLSALADGDTP